MCIVRLYPICVPAGESIDIARNLIDGLKQNSFTASGFFWRSPPLASNWTYLTGIHTALYTVMVYIIRVVELINPSNFYCVRDTERIGFEPTETFSRFS